MLKLPGAHPPRHEEARRDASPPSRARRCPMPRATSSAASRWSSTPARIGTLHAGRVRRATWPAASTPTSSASRIGVCAGITPFNFPAMIPLWMFPMAIVCGNTFVLKPSEQDPMTPMLLAELALEAGVPPGVLNVVHGGKESVDALCTHPDIKAVSFVGSCHVGEHVYKLATRARQARAMHDGREEPRGGDARREQGAVARTRSSARASAPRASAAWRPSVAVLVGEAQQVDPRHRREGEDAQGRTPAPRRAPTSGPVISKQAKERIEGLIEQGVKEGAKLELDGRNADGPRLREGQLHRAHDVLRREARHDDLRPGDLRPGAGAGERRHARRGDRR